MILDSQQHTSKLKRKARIKASGSILARSQKKMAVASFYGMKMQLEERCELS